MPSPIGHALGGIIVGGFFVRRMPNRRLELEGRGPGLKEPPNPDQWAETRAVLGLCMAAAVAPDLDFLWGRHNMETHSLGAALLAGALAYPFQGRSRALAVALAWTTHVLFDWMGSDTTPPIGVMALWPLTAEYYFAHWYVFEAISRRYWLPGFWAHNVRAVWQEIQILGPFTLLTVFVGGQPHLRRKHERLNQAGDRQ